MGKARGREISRGYLKSPFILNPHVKPWSNRPISLRRPIRSHCPTPTIGDVNPQSADIVKKCNADAEFLRHKKKSTKWDRKQGHTARLPIGETSADGGIGGKDRAV